MFVAPCTQRVDRMAPVLVGNLEPEAAAVLASEHGVEASPRELAADATIRRRLDAAVDTANARLSRVELVKAYTVLPVFWEPGSDEITPTMKLRRSVIAEKFAGEIAALYDRDWT